METPPDDVRDEAYRIAKVWGCLCTPKITAWNQDSSANLLHVTLRHQKGCNYRPISFFEDPPEIDDEAIAADGVRAKKLRQRVTRKYNKRGARK